MPNLNLRLNWRFLFYKELLIFAFLSSCSVPNSNGGFCSMLLGGAAMAATEVGECVKCTGTCNKKGSCGSYCVTGYCAGVETVIPACNGYAKRNLDTEKCECKPERVVACFSVWSFFDNDDNWCDCATVSMCTNTTLKTPQPCCNSGSYPTGVSANQAACATCPEHGLTNVSGNCTPASDKSKSNMSGGVGANPEYNGCYLSSTCKGTDTTGTFSLTGDCRHEAGGGFIGIIM